MVFKIDNDSLPLIRIMPIPPGPGGVAIAAMVLSSMDCDVAVESAMLVIPKLSTL